MARRKEAQNKWKNPMVIVGFTGIIALAVTTVGLAVFFNNRSAQNEYYAAVEEHRDLIKKETNLKPNVSDITTGKFNLQGKEKSLTKGYTTLVKAMFGDARSSSAIDNAQGEYEKYFGTKGYKTMRQIAYKGNSFVATRNTGTKVTFSHFNLEKQTIKVIIYSQFDVNPNTETGNVKQGLVYITTTYHFDKGYAQNANVQASFINDDD